MPSSNCAKMSSTEQEGAGIRIGAERRALWQEPNCTYLLLVSEWMRGYLILEETYDIDKYLIFSPELHNTWELPAPKLPTPSQGVKGADNLKNKVVHCPLVAKFFKEQSSLNYVFSTPEGRNTIHMGHSLLWFMARFSPKSPMCTKVGLWGADWIMGALYSSVD